MRRVVAVGLLALVPLVGGVLPYVAVAQGQERGFFGRLFGGGDEAGEDGGGFLENLIEDSLSGAGREVRVEGFAGALSSRATLDLLTIADDEGIWLTLRDVVLDWNRSALLRGRLEVSELTAGEILLPRLPDAGAGQQAAVPSPEAQGFSLPELPVAVRIEQVEAERVFLGEPLFGEEAEVTLSGSVSLAGGAGAAEIRAERIDGEEGVLSLEAGYDNSTQELLVDLALEEGPDGIVASLIDLPGRPSIALSVVGEGPIGAFAAEIGLATGGEERLAGQVRLSEARGGGLGFSAEIGGDIAPVFLPEYRDFFGPEIGLVVAGATLPEGGMRLDALRLNAEALRLEGQLAIGPDGLPERVSLSGRIANEGGSPVLLPLAGAPTRVGSVELEADFDASEGEEWEIAVVIADLDREGFDADRIALEGTGQIAAEEGPDGAPVRRVTAALDFVADDLDLADGGAQSALGERVTGRAEIAWSDGAPLRFDVLRVEGESYELSAEGQVEFGDPLLVRGEAMVSANDISVFSGLAGRPLEGSAEIRAQGSGAVLAGSFDLSVEGTAEDLMIGDPRIDPLLGGTAELVLRTERSETGTRIETFRIETPELTARAEGRLATGDSQLALEATVRDTSLVSPELDGAAELRLTAEEDAGGWRFDLDAEGAGASVAADGTVSGLGEDPVVTGEVAADVADLSAFAGLAGRPLSGRVSLTAEGRSGFDLRSAAVTLAAEGQGLAIGDPRIDPLLDGPVEIAADLARDGDRLQIDALRVDAPTLAARAEGAIENLMVAPVFTGTASVASEDLSALSALAGRELGGALEAETEGTLAFDLNRFDLVLDAAATDLDPGLPGLEAMLPGRTTLRLNAAREGPRVTVDAATLEGERLGAEVTGEVTRLDEAVPVFSGRAALRADEIGALSEIAGRPLGGSVDVTAEGTAAFDGSRFDLTVDGTTTDLVPGLAAAEPVLAGTTTLAAEASRTGDTVTVDRLAVENPQLRAEGAFELSELGDFPAFDGRLEAQVEDLSAFSGLAGRDLSGSVAATVAGSAAADASRFDLEVEATATDLDPGLPGAAAALAGTTTIDLAAARAGETVTVERLSLENPQITLSGQGVVTDPLGAPAFDGRVELAAPELGAFSGLAKRDLAGAVEATFEGEAALDLRLLDASLTARGNNLDFGLPGAQALLAGVSSLDITAVRDGEVVTLSRLSLESGNLKAQGTGRLTNLDGTPVFEGELRASAETLAPLSARANRQLGGSLTVELDGLVAADLARFDVEAAATGRNLRIGQADADRLLAGTTTVELDAEREEGVIRITQAQVDAPGFDAQATGSLGASGAEVELSARLADIGPYAPGFDGPVTVSGSLAQTNGTLRVDLDGTGPGGIEAGVAGTVNLSGPTVDLAIDGAAPLAAANRFVQPRTLAGVARFDLRMRGAPGLEALSGTVSTDDARLVAPTFGIVLEGIDLDARLDGGRLSIDGAAVVQSGGRLSVDGSVGLSGNLPADLAVTLDSAVLVDPELFRTSVSGRIDVDGPLRGGGRIGGELTLGETEIRIPSTGLGAGGPIPEITHVNEPAAVRATRARAGLLRRSMDGTDTLSERRRNALGLDLLIRAENRIFVRGRGLDAELGGELRLRGTTTDVIPSGQFELIRGRLDILGQRLVLDEGSIRLQGDFVPIIRLVARTDAGDVTVLVVVEGPVSEPDINFLSEPELPEEEVLARLLFGRGIDEISPLQAAQLASAVATLAGRGPGFGEDLRQNLGLDDLDLTTSENGEAALRAGKYLTENIYTDVVVDSQGDTQINLNLDLTPSITVKGGVGSDGGAGLGIYFERDY